MMGVAALGGAEDGRFVPTIWDGASPRQTDAEKKSWLARLSRSWGGSEARRQGARARSRGPSWLQLTALAAPTRDFPASIAVSLLQVGRLSIATVPVV